MLLHLILSIFCYSALAAALNSSTYYFAQEDTNITFTLTAAADTGDLFFRLSAPGSYDWVSIGIGSSMKDALTFIAYPSKNGTSLVWSPRLSSGNTEPAYSKDIDSSLVYDKPGMNSIDATDGLPFTLSAICRNCTHWSNPPLDLTSTQAPFMWAIGQGSTGFGPRWTNAVDAPLRKHFAYASFNMNMLQATVQTNPTSQLPDLGNSTDGASSNTTVTSGHDLMSPLHAALIILGILVLIPIETVMRTCFKSIKFHACMMTFVTLFFVVGIALGFMLSPQFIRSKSYTSGHQILGIFVLALFALQIPLGIFAERQQRRQRRTSASSPLTDSSTPSGKTKLPISQRIPVLSHASTAWLLVLICLINSCLGWTFGVDGTYNRFWVPTIIGFFIAIVIASGVRYMCLKTRKDMREEMNSFNVRDEQEDRIRQAQYEAYQMQTFGAPAQQAQEQVGHGEMQYPNVQVPGSYR